VKIVLRGEFDRGVAMNRGPDRRVRLLIGLGLRQRLVEMEILAVEGDLVLGPGHLHDLQHLARNRGALIEIDAPADEFMLVNADAGAEFDAAARELVEHRHFLGEADGVV
jgi:hypothetical protein